MARRGLLHPVAYQAERRQLARERREAFLDPPIRRNRVWQFDFFRVRDHWRGHLADGRHGRLLGQGRDGLSAGDHPDRRGHDRRTRTAITSAEMILGRPLIADCVDAATGEAQPLVIVTDNGPAMRSIAVARWFNARPHLRHVRTRHKAPETNGVIERWFESLKYERLYRHDIDDGLTLGEHVAEFLDEFNRIRPHEAIAWQRPLERYLQTPATPKPTDPNSEQES